MVFFKLKLQQFNDCDQICSPSSFLALENGGVAEAVKRLNDELNNIDVHSRMSDNPSEIINHDEFIIAHGLWQWRYRCMKNHRMNNSKYLLFPHGMLDVVQESLPIQTYKNKSIGGISRQKFFVMQLQALPLKKKKFSWNTFIPYQCKEIVTGLGVASPIGKIDEEGIFLEAFPILRGTKFYYILVVFIQKRNRFINQFVFENGTKEDKLVLAGPRDTSNKYEKFLRSLIPENEKRIIWTGMLKGDQSGVHYILPILILPSHQENYGMVAESLSVGTPVFITNKVNLWREIEEFGAGFVSEDNQRGINNLLSSWNKNEHSSMKENALNCFLNKMHIQNTVKKIISIFK